MFGTFEDLWTVIEPAVFVDLRSGIQKAQKPG